MPAYLITAPDGRKFRVTGEGSKEEALAHFQSAYKPAEPAGPSEADRALVDETESPGLVAIGRGFMDTAQGLKQIGLQAADATDKSPYGIRARAAVARTGLDPDAGPSAQEYTQQVGGELEQYEKLAGAHPVKSFLGRGLGNVASTPIPGAGAGASIPARLATSALTNAAASGAQFVPEGESRAANVGLGAAFGVAGQGVGEGLGAGGRKLINAAAGDTVDDASREIIDAGRRADVPVFFDDVANSATAKKISQTAEYVPLAGTGAGRKLQSEKAKAATQRLLGELKADGLSDDYFGEIQGGLKTRLSQFRASASRLYDKAEKQLDPLGDIELGSFRQTLRDGIKEELDRGSLANTDVVTTLQKYLDAPELTQAGRSSFSSVRRLRSDLGDDISDYYTGRNAAIGAKGVSLLQKAKNSLEVDMSGFAQKAGDKGKAWKDADSFYKKNITPFKNTALKDLVNSPEPEKAWKYLVASGGLGSRSKQMYNALDERGRAAVRYGLAKEAFDRASAEGRPFSPARFAGYLEDMKEPIDTFFKGSDRAEIDGFAKLMRHIERSGQYMENPPTGQRAISAAMGAGGVAAFMDPAAAGLGAGVLTSALGVKLLFQTRYGRDLLLASSKATPGTAKFDRMVRNFVNIASRGGALSAAQPEASPSAAAASPSQRLSTPQPGIPQ